MNAAEELKSRLMDWGATFTGFCRLGGKLPENLSSLSNAAVVGIRLSDFIIDEITDCPTYTYFHHYRAVNALIDQITLRGLLFIQEKGYNAVAVPASQTVNGTVDPYCGIFPHKTAAVMAGLGWIGRSGLFVSSKYGPRVRLGTILTDMELPQGPGICEQGCGECGKCVESCPAMALTGNLWSEGSARESIVDARACSEYMNSKFKHIGRGSVCGICIRVCPYGGK